MKKLDKMNTDGNKEGGEAIEEKDDYEIDVLICDCCNLSSTSTPTQSMRESGEEKNDGLEQGHDRNLQYEDNKFQKNLDNPKLLIAMGLGLTIPIVLLDFTYNSINEDYVILALATPVQFILGRPFYIRFYKAAKRQRKG